MCEDVKVSVQVWSERPVGGEEKRMVEELFIPLFEELAVKTLMALNDVNSKWKMSGCIDLVKKEVK